jgi:hypothetical protein
MFYTRKISEYKAIEIGVFQRTYGPVIINFNLQWETKSCGFDHWGFRFRLHIHKYEIFSFLLYDIRHQENYENCGDVAQ